MADQGKLFTGLDATHQMTDVAAILQFMLAGNSRFTIVSKKTGVRFTYRVRNADDKPAFVSVLTGPNNEDDYEFIGSIFNSNVFVPGRKSRIKRDAPSVTAFAWVIDRILKGLTLPNLEFWHEGRCGRCARPLTDPVSIQSGFGPECIKHFTRHDFMMQDA